MWPCRPTHFSIGKANGFIGYEDIADGDAPLSISLANALRARLLGGRAGTLR